MAWTCIDCSYFCHSQDPVLNLLILFKNNELTRIECIWGLQHIHCLLSTINMLNSEDIRCQPYCILSPQNMLLELNVSPIEQLLYFPAPWQLQFHALLFKNVHINVVAECISLCLPSLTYMMCLRLMQGHMLYFHVLVEGSVVYMFCHFFSHHLLMDV